MLSVRIDLSELQRAKEKTEKHILRGLRDAVNDAAQEGAREAKAAGRYRDRTGRLRGSIEAKEPRGTPAGYEAVMVARAPYASFVEGGTRPHIIRPKQRFSQGRVTRGSVLVFQAGGRTVYASFVRHPGTNPLPFMGPGFQKAERVLEARLEKLADETQKFWR